MVIFLLALVLSALPFAAVAIYPYLRPDDEEDVSDWIQQLRAMRSGLSRPLPGKRADG
jgi:hypothetical protein